MIKKLEVIWIIICVFITLLLYLLLGWIKPLRYKLIKDLTSYALRIAALNREVGNYEVADFIEKFFKE